MRGGGIAAVPTRRERSAPNSEIGLVGGRPSGAAFLFLAAGMDPAPLSLPGGCTVYLDFVSAIAMITAALSPLGPFALDAAGVVTLPYTVPPDPALAGQSVAVQAYTLDPAAPNAFILSNALILVVGI